MPISCQKICDSLAGVVAGLSLSASAIRIAATSSVSLGLAIGSGVYTLLTALVVAKAAQLIFEELGWAESDARSCTQWIVASVYTIATAGAIFAGIGLVSSVVEGVLLALSSSLMLVAGVLGPSLIIGSIVNLLDTQYNPRPWDEITHQFAYTRL